METEIFTEEWALGLLILCIAQLVIINALIGAITTASKINENLRQALKRAEEE